VLGHATWHLYRKLIAAPVSRAGGQGALNPP
jgi:uncharacterized membrane protein